MAYTVKIDKKEMNLIVSGCGCCGGCGCDDTCEGCETGLPANKQGDFCVPEDNCCQKKVRFTTVYVKH